MPAIKYNTQLGYLATLKDLAEWARREGYGWRAEIGDLKPIGKQRHKSDGRNPFTSAQLRLIFQSPIYKEERVENTTIEYAGVPVDARYWIPLIGLLTGMRLNEICQLDVNDLKTDESGLAYIYVNGLSESKSLKTRYSERRMPLHYELLRLGFIEFVHQANTAGKTKIFSGLKLSRRGYYSEEFSKWFGRTFLQSIGAKTEKTSFHSFRHTFRDTLRKANVSTELAQALGGWSSGEGVSESYGSRNFAHSLRSLEAAISSLEFDICISEIPKISS